MVSWLPVLFFFTCAHLHFLHFNRGKTNMSRPQFDQSAAAAAADEEKTLPKDAILASLWALDQLYVPAMHLGKRRE